MEYPSGLPLPDPALVKRGFPHHTRRNPAIQGNTSQLLGIWELMVALDTICMVAPLEFSTRRPRGAEHEKRLLQVLTSRLDTPFSSAFRLSHLPRFLDSFPCG